MTRRRPDASSGVGAPDVFVCACASARLVARSLTQFYDRCLAGTGVEAPQFALMVTLAIDGPLNQAALGRRHGLDKTTVSRNVRLLERYGWIRVVPGMDARERRYALTAEGRRRLAAARRKWDGAQDRLRAQMSASEWRAMFRAFQAAVDAAHRAR